VAAAIAAACAGLGAGEASGDDFLVGVAEDAPK
jgi:hypothetical protein